MFLDGIVVAFDIAHPDGGGKGWIDRVYSAIQDIQRRSLGIDPYPLDQKVHRADSHELCHLAPNSRRQRFPAEILRQTLGCGVWQMLPPDEKGEPLSLVTIAIEQGLDA